MLPYFKFLNENAQRLVAVPEVASIVFNFDFCSTLHVIVMTAKRTTR
jgi:hypothetical protein